MVGIFAIYAALALSLPFLEKKEPEKETQDDARTRIFEILALMLLNEN